MNEVQALKLLAEIIHETDDARLSAVATFGGNGNGLPGIRVEDVNGAKFFLVPDLSGEWPR